MVRLAGCSSVPVAARPAQPAVATAARVEVRVNQVGYDGRCAKIALVMSRAPLPDRTYAVLDASTGRTAVAGRLGLSRGPWSPIWRYVYALDFSPLSRAGRYAIAIAGVRSPSFAIDAPRSLFEPLANAAVRFFQAQRDGPNVIQGQLHRQPSHLLDASASVYRQPVYRDTTLIGPLQPTGSKVDAAGGWSDAGDYVKFVETGAFADALMLFTSRDYGGSGTLGQAVAAEARFGLDWLMRMWDSQRRVLHYQVGIGDGNGSSLLGDHDFWRLPQVDDRRNEHPGSQAFFVKYRPVFVANSPGGPISPNLAGRVAGVFGLCAQVFATTDRALAQRCQRSGETIYALADRAPRTLLTASPGAYYSDPEWHDDMELGAVELYLGRRALGGPPARSNAAAQYIVDAGRWANAYISSPTDGQDSLNLYDVSALAHFDLARVLRADRFIHHIAFEVRGNNINIQTDPAALEQDYAGQLALASRLAARDPFRLADTSTNLDTVPHALGYAIQARLYDVLIGRPDYEAFAQTQLNWVLGENPWGATFMVGAGTAYPRCLAHQVANLGGSLTGTRPLLLGATVDGPTAPAGIRQLGAPDGYRPCPPRSGGDPFAGFNSGLMAYTDNVTSFATSEPSDDFTALALLAFAQSASQG